VIWAFKATPCFRIITSTKNDSKQRCLSSAAKKFNSVYILTFRLSWTLLFMALAPIHLHFSSLVLSGISGLYSYSQYLYISGLAAMMNLGNNSSRASFQHFITSFL